MTKLKYCIINAISIILLAYFSVFYWNFLTASTPRINTDYKTFYLTLRNPDSVYKTFHYARVYKTEKKIINKQEKPIFYSGRVKDAINMDTPSMNLISKALVNISDRLSVNTFAWVYLSLLCAGIGVALLLYTTSEIPSRYMYFFPLLLLFFTSAPVVNAFWNGQVSLFIFPLLVLCFILNDLKRLKSCAILLGLLASLKLFFVIFILLFMIRKKWMLSFLFVASFVFFTFLPLLYFPWHVYSQFYALTQNHMLYMLRSVLQMNGSLLGLICKLIYFFNIKLYEMQVSIIATLICLYLIIRWIIYDYNTLRHLTEFVDELRFSFLIVIALICSPLAWLYYYLFLIIPVFVFYKISKRYQLSKTFYVFFVGAPLLPILCWHSREILVVAYIQQFAAVAALLCWFACLFCAAAAVRDKRRITASSPVFFVTLLIAQSVLNLMFLSHMYGAGFFLDIHLHDYINNLEQIIWVR